MFAYIRKSSPSAARRPAIEPNLKRSTRVPPVNPRWQRFALSRGPLRDSADGGRSREFGGRGASIQRKAVVGSPDDAFERQADRMADQVLGGARSSTVDSAEGSLQRKCAECQDDENDTIRAKHEPSAPAAPGSGARTAVHAVSHGGEPLPNAVRAYFEPRFGRDFAAVRIHTDRRAAEAARGIAAEAFTLGEHVAFAEGRYAPDGHAGRHLLAHELAHVLQQRTESAHGGEQLQRKPAPAMTDRVGGTLWAKGPGGKDLPPSLDDISQGNLGDCYLFAAMSAIVSSNPDRITHMIHDNGNGTYTVTFQGIGFWSAAKQTVSLGFPAGGKHGDLTARKAFWPLIIEKAYAQQKGGYDKIVAGNAGDAVDDMIDDGPSRFDPRDHSASYIMGKIKKALEKKWPITILSPEKKNASGAKKQIAANTPGFYIDHAYAVIGIDPVKNRIKLFNPWGNHHPNNDGWVPVEQVKKFFVEVNIND